MTEDQLQAKFWAWAWNSYPEARRHMWAVPNSAIGMILNQKDLMQANKMKATGLLEGVWDLHIFWHNKFHIIETKIPGGRLSIDHVDSKGRKHYGQKEWGEMMVSHGAISHVYYSLEEGQAIFRQIIENV